MHGWKRTGGKWNPAVFSLDCVVFHCCPRTGLNILLVWYFRIFPMSSRIFSLWFTGRLLCLMDYWLAAWLVSIQTGLLGSRGSVCTVWQRETRCTLSRVQPEHGTLVQPEQGTLWFLPAPLACSSFPWRPGQRQDGAVKWFPPGSYSEVYFPVLTSCL